MSSFLKITAASLALLVTAACDPTLNLETQLSDPVVAMDQVTILQTSATSITPEGCMRSGAIVATQMTMAPPEHGQEARVKPIGVGVVRTNAPCEGLLAAVAGVAAAGQIDGGTTEIDVNSVNNNDLTLNAGL